MALQTTMSAEELRALYEASRAVRAQEQQEAAAARAVAAKSPSVSTTK